MEEAGPRGGVRETDASDRRRVTSCPAEATPPVVMETERGDGKQADDLWETPQGPGPGPVVVQGPGPGPGVVQGPGPGPGPGPVVVQGPGPGPGVVQGPGPGPVVVQGPGPGPGPGVVQGPGPGPGVVQGPGLGPGPGVVRGPGPGPGPVVVQGPGPGPVVVQGPGPGPVVVQGPGPGPVVVQGPGPGPVVVRGKNPAGEKLERVRKWSITTYKCARQSVCERLGRGSRTVDLDLERRLDLLRDDRRRYDDVTRLARTLANQLARLAVTHNTLGQAFGELSVRTPPLHVEFGVNADAHQFLARSGRTLADAVTAFAADMTTLVTMTIGDTMINAKQYEAARMEYDAYRVDLEELNLGPRDPVSWTKLVQAQKDFQVQKENYQRIREDLNVKVRLLDHNKVQVLQQQLGLLHGAVVSHTLSCHAFLEQNLNRVQIQNPDLDSRSWLEES